MARNYPLGLFSFCNLQILFYRCAHLETVKFYSVWSEELETITEDVLPRSLYGFARKNNQF